MKTNKEIAADLEQLNIDGRRFAMISDYTNRASFVRGYEAAVADTANEKAAEELEKILSAPSDLDPLIVRSHLPEEPYEEEVKPEEGPENNLNEREIVKKHLTDIWKGLKLRSDSEVAFLKVLKYFDDEEERDEKG